MRLRSGLRSVVAFPKKDSDQCEGYASDQSGNDEADLVINWRRAAGTGGATRSASAEARIDARSTQRWHLHDECGWIREMKTK